MRNETSCNLTGARWRIELLGGVRMVLPGQEAVRFRSQRVEQLLAYLALRGREVLRVELVDKFWPELSEEAGRDNLSTTLSALRRKLESFAPGARQLLHADRQSIALDFASVEIDVAEFERALQQAERTQDNAQRKRLLERAAMLYRGDLLPGCYADWALVEQERLRTRYLDGLAQWAKMQELAGEWEGVRETATRALTLDPYNETLCQSVMRAQATLGNPAAALDAYEKLSQRLHVELGIVPSEATRELAERIRRDRDAFTAERAPEIFLPSETRRTAEDTLLSESSIPPRWTRFFGREEELAHLEALLTASEHRLVTLTGPGGAGKTRLALAVAERMAERASGRLWCVPLADIPHARLLPFALARALKLTLNPDADPLEQIVTTLRIGPCLLVLDNFEHLLKYDEPEGKEGGRQSSSPVLFVRLLLERIPTLTCLITSRRALGLSGEREFPVRPFAVPNATDSPEALRACPCIALYVDRAQALSPDFALTEANAGDVVALCRRLEGMPLALEVAASWIKTLPPAQMLAQIERSGALLVSRQRDLPVRHRDLHATIAWSYDLLHPDVRRFLARLSVFPGDWTAEAAFAIAGEDSSEIENLERLAELQEHSLVVAESSQGEARFRLMETIREFAAEQLAAGQVYAQMRRRHAAYYSALATAAASYLMGAEQQDWLERLEREHAHFRLALEWYLDRRQDVEAGTHLAERLGWFWYVRGYLREGERWLELACSVNPNRDSPAWQYALLRSGQMARDLGEWEKAEARLNECLKLARASNNTSFLADTLHNLGLILIDRCDYAAAQARYREALPLFEQVGNQNGIAISLHNLGMAARYEGNLDQAIPYCEEALALYRELGSSWGIATALHTLGCAKLDLGEEMQAEALLEASLQLQEALGNRRNLAWTWLSLAELALQRKEWETARQRQRQALAVFRSLGSRRGTIAALNSLAYTAMEMNDAARAVRLFAFTDSVEREHRPCYAESEVRQRAHTLTALQAHLGARDFARAQMEGRLLTWNEAVEQAGNV